MPRLNALQVEEAYSKADAQKPVARERKSGLPSVRPLAKGESWWRGARVKR
jgi:hypothetical protein